MTSVVIAAAAPEIDALEPLGHLGEAIVLALVGAVEDDPGRIDADTQRQVVLHPRETTSA
jgi:hypothetical protein